MPTTIITPGRFLQFQEKFYQTNIASPVFATVRLTGFVDDSVADPLSSFVGSQERTIVKESVIPVMYSRSHDSVLREKFGIEQSKQGSLYIAPKLLKQKLGTWKLVVKNTLVNFLDKEYLVEKAFYIGDIPQFGTCLAVELVLKSATKGI